MVSMRRRIELNEAMKTSLVNFLDQRLLDRFVPTGGFWVKFSFGQIFVRSSLDLKVRLPQCGKITQPLCYTTVTYKSLTENKIILVFVFPSILSYSMKLAILL